MALVTKKEFRHFFKDRLSLSLLFGCALLTVINIFSVALRVRPSEIQVAVRYSQYSLTYDRASWTVLYELALFTVMVFVINGIFAVKTREIRRAYALSILALTILVLVVTVLASNALLTKIIV